VFHLAFLREENLSVSWCTRNKEWIFPQHLRCQEF